MKDDRALYGKKIRVGNAVRYLAAFLLVYVILVLVPFVPREFMPTPVEINAFYGGDFGQKARLLNDGETSLRARLEVIGNAEREVCIASFGVTDDSVGQLFFGAVYAALRRGVKVALLVDGKCTSVGGERWNAFLALGGELYRYAPLNLWETTTVNDCMHDKFVTADGKAVVLGGRNIGERYYYPTAKLSAHDCDVLVYGETCSAAEQVATYFRKLLSLPHTVKIEKSFSDKKRARLDSAADAAINAYRAFGSQFSDSVYDGAVGVGKVTLVHNGVANGAKQPVIFDTVLQFMQSGKDCVLQTPYTALVGAQRERFIAAAAGGNVTLLTNSLASSPNLPAFSHYLRYRVRYAHTFDIYEFQSDERSVHAKTMAVGNDLSIVGSFNMDERSIRIDTESVLVIEGEEFNSILRGVLDGYQSKSAHVDKKGNYDGGETVKPKFGKGFLFHLVGVLFSGVAYLV